MEYSYREPPEKHNGGTWFGHEIHLRLEPKREAECWEFLNSTVGPKGKAWRLQPKTTFNVFYHDGQCVIRFAAKNRAVFFKLSWDECPERGDDIAQLLKKLSLNSHFGKFMVPRSTGAPISTTKPSSNPLPWISSVTSGIHPTWSMPTGSGKTMTSIYQAKSRASRNPRDEIVFLDYESSIKIPWHFNDQKKSKESCEARGDTVMTTEELQKRISGEAE